MMLIAGVVVRLFCTVAIVFLAPLAGDAETPGYVPIPVRTLVVFPGVFAGCLLFVLQVMGDQKSRMLLHKQLSEFTLSDAKCALESDRRYVERMIQEIYTDVATFEHYVRTEVSRHMKHVYSPGSQHYSWFDVYSTIGAPLLVCFMMEGMPLLRQLEWRDLRAWLLAIFTLSMLQTYVVVKLASCACTKLVQLHMLTAWKVPYAAAALALAIAVALLAQQLCLGFFFSPNLGIQMPILAIWVCLFCCVGRHELRQFARPLLFWGRMPQQSTS